MTSDAERKAPLLESGIALVREEVEEEDDATTLEKFSFKRLLRFIGPGLLMSIAYVDPGNLESDLQTGASTGYVLLWLMLLTTILGFLVQLQSAKLGVATGKHLAQHCREQYSPVPRILLWIMAEVAIIGSDIQEVIGSAIAILLLSGGRVPLWAGVLITAVDAFLLLFMERLGVRILEAMFAVMIGVMVGSFGVMFVNADIPADEVVAGFLIPRLPLRDVPTAVALIGSLIMPHNIYLHSALVLSRRSYMTTVARKKEAVTYFGIESALSLMAAVVINLFVVAVFAKGFYGKEYAPEIGLANAGQYLGETYGQATVFIWALGLLAAGQSSTMTGTYTGQFVMDGYLNLKVSPWFRITLTRLVAIVPTLFLALLYKSESSQLDKLNQALNLLQSIQLPFALVPLLLFTSSPAIMGRAFVTSRLISALTWGIAMLVVAINAFAVYQATADNLYMQTNALFSLAVFCVIAAYIIFLVYLIVQRPKVGPGDTCPDVPKDLPSDDQSDPVGSLDAGVASGHKPNDENFSGPLLHSLVLKASTTTSGHTGHGTPPSSPRSWSRAPLLVVASTPPSGNAPSGHPN